MQIRNYVLVDWWLFYLTVEAPGAESRSAAGSRTLPPHEHAEVRRRAKHGARKHEATPTLQYCPHANRHSRLPGSLMARVAAWNSGQTEAAYLILLPSAQRLFNFTYMRPQLFLLLKHPLCDRPTFTLIQREHCRFVLALHRSQLCLSLRPHPLLLPKSSLGRPTRFH
jgi:hypothetical protein